VSIGRRRGAVGLLGDTADIGAVEAHPPSINPGPGLQAIINFITANSDATRTVNVVPGRTDAPSRHEPPGYPLPGNERLADHHAVDCGRHGRQHSRRKRGGGAARTGKGQVVKVVAAFSARYPACGQTGDLPARAAGHSVRCRTCTRHSLRRGPDLAYRLSDCRGGSVVTRGPSNQWR
jgi:hypothetical protein